MKTAIVVAGALVGAYLLIGAVVGIIGVVVYTAFEPSGVEAGKVFLRCLFMWPVFIRRGS